MDKNNQVPSLNFPQVVVVEASAGSGKTYALAKRYLQLLINPKVSLDQIPLRSVLAITFTNKAMLEMKERILYFLKRIALDNFEDKAEEAEVISLLGVDENTARLKAKILVDLIIKNYNFFQIQTIDSFINALLLGSAINIDRSAHFKIKRDYRKYLAYCLDLVIERAQKDPGIYSLMEEFLRHYLFVENRSGWFPRDDILLFIQTIFRLVNKQGKTFIENQGSTSDIIKQKKVIYKKILTLSQNLPQKMNANTKRHILSFLEKNKDSFDISSLPAAFASKNPPLNKGAELEVGFSNKWKDISKALTELVELDSEVAYNPYIKLFSELLDFFQLVSKKEDILFLEELNRKVGLLFDEGGVTVAEIYYRLATRFKHYLIDEFQDTSVLQWQNLYLMVEDALSCGGTLFYVGDKKQAIYRFRGGQAQLFDRVKGGFSHFNVSPVHLKKNWRSQKAIVDFNNRIFSLNNLKTALINSKMAEDIGGGQDLEEVLGVFSDADQEIKKENSGGFVSVKRLDESNQSQRDEIMKSELLSLTAELKRSFRLEDIAILARNNNEVELLTSWLLEANIAVESEKTLNVLENSQIRELVSFLKFLYCPRDDLSLASFILGDIFSKITSIPPEQMHKYLFSLKKKKGNGLPRESLFERFSQEKKFKKFLKEYFIDFIEMTGVVSSYELVVSIYQRFNLLGNFSQLQAFFMKFLELIKTKEEDCTGLNAFLLYLDDAEALDLYVSVARSNSLKVLTVHKAKGLEFEVVIIPFLRIDITPETAGKGSSSYVTSKGSSDFSLLRITKNHRQYSKNLKIIYSENYKKACIDELNNLYVALTRAKSELYIYLPKKSAASSNKATFFIPNEVTISGKRRTLSSESHAKEEALIEIDPSKYKDWISTLEEEFTTKAEVINREKIREGKIIHAILSRINNCQGKDLNIIIESAYNYAKSLYKLSEDLPYYKEKLTAIIIRKNLKDIFYPKDAEVFCEKEVIDINGNSKRIDRLIVKSDQVWVVDYKSSANDKNQDHSQVVSYIKIITNIYPKAKVRGFLLYLNDLSLEEAGLKS